MLWSSALQPSPPRDRPTCLRSKQHKGFGKREATRTKFNEKGKRKRRGKEITFSGAVDQTVGFAVVAGQRKGVSDLKQQ